MWVGLCGLLLLRMSVITLCVVDDPLLESKTVSFPTKSVSSSSPNRFLRGAYPSSAFLPFPIAAPNVVPILMGCITFAILTIPPVGTAEGATSTSSGLLPANTPRKDRSWVVISGSDPSSGIACPFAGMTSIAPACSFAYVHHPPSDLPIVSEPIPPFLVDRSRNCPPRGPVVAASNAAGSANDVAIGRLAIKNPCC